jgi:hypothetical protein
MTPFAFQRNDKRPARTRQGFAIEDRRAARALDRTCPAAKTALGRKAKGETTKGLRPCSLSLLVDHSKGEGH